MLKTETKIEKRYKAEPNPYLCKSGFYITELNMGFLPNDGYKLLSTSDLAGPFKTLERVGHSCSGVGKLANFILLILDICLSNSLVNIKLYTFNFYCIFFYQRIS